MPDTLRDRVCLKNTALRSFPVFRWKSIAAAIFTKTKGRIRSVSVHCFAREISLPIHLYSRITKTWMKDFGFRLFSFRSESRCSRLIIRNDDRNRACFTTVSHIPWKHASRPLSSRCTAIMRTLEIGGAGLKRETKSRRFALCRKNVLVRHPRRGASSSFNVNWLLSRPSMNRVALSAREFFWNEYAYDHPFHWIAVNYLWLSL